MMSPENKTLTEEEISALRTELEGVIQTIFDPEIPVNIWELGLIYKLEVFDNAAVFVEMTLTAPNCPVADILPAQVEGYLKATAGVTGVTVDLTWDPPWTPDRMSDAAKLELGMY